MEFRTQLPATAVPHANGSHYTFRDTDGKMRNAYPMKRREAGSDSVIFRVNAEQYERFLSEGMLDRQRVISFSPEVRKLFAKHSNEQKISFTVQFVKAVYQSALASNTESITYEVEVWNGKDSYRTFRGDNRMHVLTEALAYMDKFDKASLTLKTKKKPVFSNTLVEKGTYEGRKYLSYVELELTLEYLTKNEGWVVLPAGT